MRFAREISVLDDWLATADPIVKLVRSLEEKMPERSLCAQFLHVRRGASQQLHVTPDRRRVRPPNELLIRYAVVASSPDPVEAEQMLVGLVRSATAFHTIDVLEEPVGPAYWTAWGLRPKPAIQVEVRSWRDETPPGDAPRVRKVEVDLEPLETVYGRVVGPGNTPVAGAIVDLLSLGRSLNTDSNGCFRFVGLSAGSHLQLRVRANGTEVLHSASADEILSSDKPLLIHMADLET